MFGRNRLDVKTPDQIRRMRRAGLVVGETLALLREQVRAGMTTADLDRIAEEHIRGAGATPSFLGYHGFTGTLCVSVNDEVVHGIPGSRELRDGDLVSIDCGAIVDGWHGDAAISLVVGGRGAGSPADLALIDATEASMWAGIAALKVGSPLYAVGAAVEDAVTKAAADDGATYGIVEDYVGHGIGTEMHQDPQVPNYRVRDKGPTVRSGLTVAIEPMVTLGSADTAVLEDDWTVVTTDASRAAHWENSVAVTDEGLWVLTELDGGKARLEALGAAYAPLD
ncbi:type I methionyl aminopeptidase [Oryzihumus leptocrescens]|uniref:Methionine aminopeptidase n=1 Tax=Oryzihumus leptocrescens TaxID=297536 RepID=A0A542ZMM3_9MICO|nr:type I methionyl aminopeptidase [Oryzihumus leptocrescens]TQL61575.1 methionyl aminopeptidase [Oryzihumus leptocrescens]